MHDLTSLDRRGIPGCAVVTEEFKDAAASQASALGMMPRIVWVPHPIQNLSKAALAELVDHHIDAILAACISSQAQSTTN